MDIFLFSFSQNTIEVEADICEFCIKAFYIWKNKGKFASQGRRHHFYGWARKRPRGKVLKDSVDEQLLIDNALDDNFEAFNKL